MKTGHTICIRQSSGVHGAKPQTLESALTLWTSIHSSRLQRHSVVGGCAWTRSTEHGAKTVARRQSTDTDHGVVRSGACVLLGDSPHSIWSPLPQLPRKRIPVLQKSRAQLDAQPASPLPISCARQPIIVLGEHTASRAGGAGSLDIPLYHSLCSVVYLSVVTEEDPRSDIVAHRATKPRSTDHGTFL